MIAQITGKVIEKSGNYLVIDCNGVGYKIYSPVDAVAKVELNEKIILHTYLITRENILDLYGFTTKQEQRMFEILIQVSGIGPKGALAILSQAKPREITESIAKADYTILTKVSGIGKKTAEKIVLELKNKIGLISETQLNEEDRPMESKSIDLESIEALEALGYSNEQARQALNTVDSKLTTTEEKVKQALKNLSK
ncbi:MAG: Holliday junction branch migration protein RuvA [Candidatus Moranbacteria bacterium]|nr:Holliday junction branch migration protein RuvA [Candidatus Moranbacteria bacterium]